MKKNNGYTFWVKPADESYVVEVDRFVNSIHKMGIYLLKEAMKANDYRFITKNKIQFLKDWQLYLNQLQPTQTENEGQPLNLEKTAIYLANSLVKTDQIYYKEMGKKLNRRDTKFMIYCIIQHLELSCKDKKELWN